MIGVHYVDQHIATGFGIHLAQPIFRNEWKENMTLEEGKKLIEKALLVLFYRDRSAINKIQVPTAHSSTFESEALTCAIWIKIFYPANWERTLTDVLMPFQSSR